MGYRRYAPLKTKKVEQTTTQLSTNFGASVVTVNLLTCVNTAPGDQECSPGQKCRGFFVEFNCSAETTTTTKTLHWAVVKNPANGLSFDPSNYGVSTRKFVFKRGMEMLPKDVGTVIKRVFFVRIPPRYSRMDEDDRISIVFKASSTESINVCLIAIGKVYV